MKTKKIQKLWSIVGAILITPLIWSVTLRPALAANLNLAQSPIFLGSKVLPNVLIIYDNSESMDGYMAGKLVAGETLTHGGT